MKTAKFNDSQRLIETRIRAANINTVAALLAATVFFSSCTAAHQISETGLEECIEIESVIARVNCYDALARRLLGNRETAVQAPPTQPNRQASEATPLPKEQIISAPDSSPDDAANTTDNAGTQASSIKAVSMTEVHADQAGQKYLNSKTDTAPHRTLFFLLVATGKDKQKRMIFNFENGQVWKQIEPRYLKTLSNLPLQVELVKGALGSYSLRLGKSGRLVKVKRIK